MTRGTVMDCEFHLQDPTLSDPVYLLEAILDASHDAVSGMGMFAFASRAGVESLIVDPEIKRFLRRSPMSLVVGIDAVTNRDALVRLQELEQANKRLSVRVFWNPTGALFHPKVARFKYPDGGQSMIVGSGNLTLGGLCQHFEAFSVMRVTAGECLDTSSLDRFLADHRANLRPIDNEALESAARNIGHGPRRRPDIERETPEPPGDTDLPASATNRFLVAQVPRAGARWHQIHFNAEVIEQFFRIRPDTTQRVYLVECRRGGSFGEPEVRPCVYSRANMNYKIEVASHRGEPYPNAGRPVAVYRELQTRSFAYMLLMPGDPGHEEMHALTERLPNVGRGRPRVMADAADIRRSWAACPLLTAIDRTVENGLAV